MARKKKIRTREELKDELSNDLMKRLNSDVFLMRRLFVMLSKAEKTPDDPMSAFDLMDLILDGREEEVAEVVGTTPDEVFGFLTEILQSQSESEDGDELGE